MPGAVLLVRHAEPVVSATVSPSRWPLSAEGIAEARALGDRLRVALDLRGAPVVSSPEPKAIQTAAALDVGGAPTDPRLREVRRPWHDDPDGFRRAVATYLAGGAVAGWEPLAVARTRFDAAVTASTTDLLVVVTHGTVATAWLGGQIPGLDPVAFWEDLGMPDAWLVDLAATTVVRVGRPGGSPPA